MFKKDEVEDPAIALSLTRFQVNPENSEMFKYTGPNGKVRIFQIKNISTSAEDPSIPEDELVFDYDILNQEEGFDEKQFNLDATNLFIQIIEHAVSQAEAQSQKEESRIIIAQ